MSTLCDARKRCDPAILTIASGDPGDMGAVFATRHGARNGRPWSHRAGHATRTNAGRAIRGVVRRVTRLLDDIPKERVGLVDTRIEDRHHHAATIIRYPAKTAGPNLIRLNQRNAYR